ncbi:CotH kinase family protein [Mycobacterium sp. 21AC1]|uniref:CotH kinase family protein n=1 Tax=[Mycobacterium] appelbergii TaxID=2939269 RepID=UPI002938F76F|nr:CotH kinase family protein [Mycobacterium sp. 21AC1]MDV3128714.1 CotH kinase family protein [Mycobacterium sp. 21AC1]
MAHTLTIDLTPAEHHDMLSAYQKDGEKKWVTADVTVDDTTVSDVAVRLKGNSTLMTLRSDGNRPPGLPEDAEFGADFVPDEAMIAMSASADDPTSLPLLISFDENAEGRGYQGLTELSVRPGTPVLNESLALSLTAETGQPSQRYAYARYTINGRTTTRLLLEHPDETYANTLFDSDGYLYKADANSRMEFVGTDQSAYSDQFKQINSADNGNLQPIINFLEWLDSADQEEFDAHLSDWFDTDSLARYLATQNLLVNGDDMGGPGQNYYLWFDLETKKLSVISWDLNLAMHGDATAGPVEKIQMGPPGGLGANIRAGTQTVTPGAAGPGPAHDNPLKTRFLESENWADAYNREYWELYDEMYADGKAHNVLDEILATIPETDGLSEQELATAADSMHKWIDERVTALDDARGE